MTSPSQLVPGRAPTGSVGATGARSHGRGLASRDVRTNRSATRLDRSVGLDRCRMEGRAVSSRRPCMGRPRGSQRRRVGGAGGRGQRRRRDRRLRARSRVRGRRVRWSLPHACHASGLGAHLTRGHVHEASVGSDLITRPSARKVELRASRFSSVPDREWAAAFASDARPGRAEANGLTRAVADQEVGARERGDATDSGDANRTTHAHEPDRP